MAESNVPTSESSTFWNECWSENEIGVYRSNASGLFNTHLLQTLPQSPEQKYNILFPLCGKSHDMKAIVDVGHRAFGIEWITTAVEAFFNENDILYQIKNDNTCQIYKGIEQSVTIFCMNFFTFNESLPPIDRIWDYGGIVAVNRSEQELYRDCLLRLMIPHRTQLYLAAHWCDNPDFVGPPVSLSDDQVANLFGSTCSIELITVVDITDKFNKRCGSQRMSKVEERLYRIIRSCQTVQNS